MARPTIRDLAEAAGVSVSTVNRVLGGGGNVRQATMQRVRDAAETIGFYGLGSIESRVAATRPRYRFGFLLQQPTRPFYRNVAQALAIGGGRGERSRCRRPDRVPRRPRAAEHRRTDAGAGRGVRRDRRRCGGASAGDRGGRDAAAARRAGLCADLAARRNRARPLCRPGQLEGRPHGRLGDRSTSARRRASSASSSATIATAARR